MVRAKKHLGQHFLKNNAVADQIAEALLPGNYNSILEVGPGTGILTQALLRRPEKLWLAEIDTESIVFLQNRFPQISHQLLRGDFLQWNLSEKMTTSFALIGNFPYNISSQIIFKMLEHKESIPQMVGMFQKEVAERLVAPPGSKTYGILSVLCAAYYHREYLFTVPPEEFNPPPKVHSAVLRMTRHSTTLPVPEKQFFQVVKTAFNQRRKTLRNSLRSLGLENHQSLQKHWGNRPEQLGYEDFFEITLGLFPD